MAKVVLLCLFLAWKLTISHGQTPCESSTLSCVCKVSDKGFIDLSSLGDPDKKPRFTGIHRVNDDYEYSYNPCYGFNQGAPDSACGGRFGLVSSCQSSTTSDAMFSLGDATTETMYIDTATNNVYLEYTNGQEGRISRVYLNCDQNADSPKLTTDSDSDTSLIYVFHLTSKYACPTEEVPTTPPETPSGSGGVAPGIIGIVLIVLVIASLPTYFIVGMIINKFLFKKDGSEIIPQKQFWINFPFLIKDGFIFTITPIVILINRNKSYESLK